MGHNDESRLAKAIDSAEADFWYAITKAYPEIKTGDDDGLGHKLRDAMDEAVRHWLDLNIPTASASCDIVVEMRPPLKGERGFMVEALTAEAALAEVLRESEDLGWIAQEDHRGGLDENGMHAVTISFRPSIRALTQEELMAAQGASPALVSAVAATGRVAPRSRHAKERWGEFVDRIPEHAGWKAYWEYPGYIRWTHADLEFSVFATPDHSTDGRISVDLTSDDGDLIASDITHEVAWDSRGTPASYIEVMRPILDAVFEKFRSRKFEVLVEATTRSIGNVLVDVPVGMFKEPPSAEKLVELACNHADNLIADNGITIEWTDHRVLWEEDGDTLKSPFTTGAKEVK